MKKMKKQLVYLGLLLLLAVCLGATKPKLDPKLVESEFAAWNAHDADKVISFFTDDVVYEDVTFGEIAHGREELRKMAAGFFAAVPDLKFEVVRSHIDRDHGSVEWVFTGTDVGLYKTGKKFSVRGSSTFELRGGKFSGNRDYYDSAAIMRQVGVIPPPKP